MTTPLRRTVRRAAWSIIGMSIMGLVLSAITTTANNHEQTVTINRQATQNAEIIDCLTKYAADLTDALQDRDTANVIARAASVELWATIRHWINHPGPNRSRDLTRAIDRYEHILARVRRTAAINPYPDVTGCLAKLDYQNQNFKLSDATIKTTSRWRDYCLGRHVTIRGTFGDDVIHGTDGNDVIIAYSGNDLVHGGKGNDVICGRRGGDVILAGLGYDQVDCGPGEDFALQAERVWSCE